MSRQLKDLVPGASERVLERVRDDLPVRDGGLSWLAGYTDGDGSISMATGAKTILVTYGAYRRDEIDRVRRYIGTLLRTPMPAVKEVKSELSELPQWRLDLRESAIVERLLGLLRPRLVAKRLQADLALLARDTTDGVVSSRAVELIQLLNHGRVGRDVACEFLGSYGPVAQ